MIKHLIVIGVAICLAVALYIVVGHFYAGGVNVICPISHEKYYISYALLISGIYAVSVLYTAILYIFLDFSDANKLKAYKREYEKNSVSKEEKDSQIKALENKVKTLEAALDSIIKKDNQ